MAVEFTDFVVPGVDFELLALLERTESGNNLYESMERGGTDEPIEGDIGFGSGENRITRIRIDGIRLTFYDDDTPTSIHLRDYFDGDGNDLTIYFWVELSADQIALVSWPVNPTSGGGGSWTYWDVTDANFTSVLNLDISVGDRFGFGLGRATAAVLEERIRVDGSFGPVTGAARVRTSAPLPARIRVDGSFGPIAGAVSIQLVPPPGLILPDLVGEEFDAVEALLLAARLRLNVVYRGSPTADIGRVLSQIPIPGTFVNAGFPVLLVVGTAEPNPAIIGPDTGVRIPHFSSPLTLDGSSFAANEQNDTEEVVAAIRAILQTQLGSRESLPNFGIPALEFLESDEQLSAISNAIVEWEPRAEFVLTDSGESLVESLAREYLLDLERTSDA